MNPNRESWHPQASSHSPRRGCRTLKPQSHARRPGDPPSAMPEPTIQERRPWNHDVKPSKRSPGPANPTTGTMVTPPGQQYLPLQAPVQLTPSPNSTDRLDGVRMPAMQHDYSELIARKIPRGLPPHLLFASTKSAADSSPPEAPTQDPSKCGAAGQYTIPNVKQACRSADTRPGSVTRGHHQKSRVRKPPTETNSIGHTNLDASSQHKPPYRLLTRTNHPLSGSKPEHQTPNHSNTPQSRDFEEGSADSLQETEDAQDPRAERDGLATPKSQSDNAVSRDQPVEERPASWRTKTSKNGRLTGVIEQVPTTEVAQGTQRGLPLRQAQHEGMATRSRQSSKRHIGDYVDASSAMSGYLHAKSAGFARREHGALHDFTAGMHPALKACAGYIQPRVTGPTHEEVLRQQRPHQPKKLSSRVVPTYPIQSCTQAVQQDWDGPPEDTNSRWGDNDSVTPANAYVEPDEVSPWFMAPPVEVPPIIEDDLQYDLSQSISEMLSQFEDIGNERGEVQLPLLNEQPPDVQMRIRTQSKQYNSHAATRTDRKLDVNANHSSIFGLQHSLEPFIYAWLSEIPDYPVSVTICARNTHSSRELHPMNGLLMQPVVYAGDKPYPTGSENFSESGSPWLYRHDTASNVVRRQLRKWSIRATNSERRETLRMQRNGPPGYVLINKTNSQFQTPSTEQPGTSEEPGTLPKDYLAKQEHQLPYHDRSVRLQYASPKAEELEYRPAVSGDLPSVLAIYNQEVLGGTQALDVVPVELGDFQFNVFETCQQLGTPFLVAATKNQQSGNHRTLHSRQLYTPRPLRQAGKVQSNNGKVVGFGYILPSTPGINGMLRDRSTAGRFNGRLHVFIDRMHRGRGIGRELTTQLLSQGTDPNAYRQDDHTFANGVIAKNRIFDTSVPRAFMNVTVEVYAKGGDDMYAQKLHRWLTSNGTRAPSFRLVGKMEKSRMIRVKGKWEWQDTVIYQHLAKA